MESILLVKLSRLRIEQAEVMRLPTVCDSGIIMEELSDPQIALNDAVAASRLKHSILSDFIFSSRGEIENLMAGDGSGSVNRRCT
jgi:hypothetical protein